MSRRDGVEGTSLASLGLHIHSKDPTTKEICIYPPISLCCNSHNNRFKQLLCIKTLAGYFQVFAMKYVIDGLSIGLDGQMHFI